jgi:hypothetical protein
MDDGLVISRMAPALESRAGYIAAENYSLPE